MKDIRAAENQEEKVCRAYVVRFYESANVLNVKKKLLFDEVMLESFVIYPLMQSAYYYTGHPRINVTVCFVNNKITTCKIVMKLFHSKALILRNCNSTYSEAGLARFFQSGINRPEETTFFRPVETSFFHFFRKKWK